jgi:hypothetical protein
VCGPNGHAGGKKWNVVRGMAISPYHENCVPHNYPSANIVLPLQCPKTNLIVGAMPLYMGVEKKGAAASAPKRGIPQQYGFHVKPERAPMLPLGGLEMEPAGQMMNQELTLTRFNGARILKLLACKNPSLTTSIKAVEWMLEKEKCVRNRLKPEHGELNATDFVNELGKSDITICFSLAYAHRDRYPKKQNKDPDGMVDREDEC